MTRSGSLAPAYAVASIDQSLRQMQEARVILETAGGSPYLGRHVDIDGVQLLNFAACSYLGLEQRAEVKAGAIDAITRFGTQFPFPRIFVQCPLYEELESALGTMTGGNALVAASTTLAHIAALPVLVEPADAVLVDQSAHASLHTATALLRANHVEPVRHNRVDLLERKVARLARSHKRVWCVLDGLYSMFGDLAPLEQIAPLLDQYPQLRLYIDDAHSTSWTGKNGRGFALDRLADRSQIVVALSLNKAFSAGGGALIFGDDADRGRVRRCGGPMLFSGPLQPGQLGAAVASAKLHLDPGFSRLQQGLRERIDLVLSLATELEVPLVSQDATPIFFVRGGPSSVSFDIARGLRAQGLYVSASAFPAVAQNQSGIRFTVSLHNTEADIRLLINALSEQVAKYALRSKEAATEVIRVVQDAGE
ncbi:MAG: aminotransferase class I/II-fold pyridoxal phosphate-dependent enzyme [Myxococcota bacterium]|nr:aminotransferase class I/II-fold pyridoxal phosphate-dependent enzyme [Myxococcota bacterium]